MMRVCEGVMTRVRVDNAFAFGNIIFLSSHEPRPRQTAR